MTSYYRLAVLDKFIHEPAWFAITAALVSCRRTLRLSCCSWRTVLTWFGLEYLAARSRPSGASRRLIADPAE